MTDTDVTEETYDPNGVDEPFALGLDPPTLDRGPVDYGVTFEEVPKINRPAPPGREPFDWATALQPIRERRGESARFATFPGPISGKSQAQSKAQAVRTALYRDVPDQHWEIKSRERGGIWGVYATYLGLLSPEQQKERDRLREERSNRIKNARAAASGG